MEDNGGELVKVTVPYAPASHHLFFLLGFKVRSTQRDTNADHKPLRPASLVRYHIDTTKIREEKYLYLFRYHQSTPNHWKWSAEGKGKNREINHQNLIFEQDILNSQSRASITPKHIRLFIFLYCKCKNTSVQEQ